MLGSHTTLILAAGETSYSDNEQTNESKFEFQLNKKSLLENVETLYSSGNTVIALREENLGRFVFRPQTKIVPLKNTQGALISALLSLGDTELDQPLIITPGDSLVKGDIYREFIEICETSGSDISLIAFNSQQSNYSYIRTNEGKLVEVCEKKIISSLATTGIFYFSSADLFIKCAEWSIINNVRTNEMFYIAPSLNYAVVKGLNTNIIEIPEESYYRFSTFGEAVSSRRRYESEYR
jgi:choline kinase